MTGPAGPGGNYTASGDPSGGSVTFRADGRITYGTFVSGPASWCSPTQSGRGTNLVLAFSRTSGTPGVIFSPPQGSYDLDQDVNIGATGGAGSCTGSWNIRDGGGAGAIVASGTVTVNNTF